ncbi:MAG: segregation/condensation protein A [Nitrospirota bacterium]|nr:MAG: segregation/condensation protein A [Nitrospirota bacterium]
MDSREFEIKSEVEEIYQVQLDSFTGPLDLLLHLIRKQQINIYDIPIALITQQYVEYLNLMKTLNLSFAGEFLVMAASLLQIKSRMLLPKEEIADQGEENVEDPREELVRQLMEYEQFKDAAGRLASHERIWRDAFCRDPMLPEEPEPSENVPVDELSLFDLLGALQEVLDRTAAQPFIDVSLDTQTVQERIHTILDQLETEPTLTFEALFEGSFSRSYVILTFLALLELVRMKLVGLFQGDLFGPIRITRRFSPDQEIESVDPT